MSDSPPLSKDLGQEALEAVFEAMFLAAFADDDFSDDERERFRTRVSELSEGRVVGERFDELLAKVTRAIFTDGTGRRLSSVAERLTRPEDRRLALEAALMVAGGDGLSKSERSLIERLGRELGVSDADVASLVAEHAGP